MQKINRIIYENDLLNDRAWKQAYLNRISGLITGTIEKVTSLEDKTSLEKLHTLQRKLCE